MNRQAVFNKAWAGLKAQGFKQSVRAHVTPGGGKSIICAYRGDNGCKCFAGHLIPDDRYSPKLENYSMAKSIARDMLDPELCGKSQTIDDINFLSLGQKAHDYSSTPKLMESALRRFARTYHLEVPA